MGVPTSEVGYTSAMPRREDHEVHKDMWGIGKKKKTFECVSSVAVHSDTQPCVIYVEVCRSAMGI